MCDKFGEFWSKLRGSQWGSKYEGTWPLGDIKPKLKSITRMQISFCCQGLVYIILNVKTRSLQVKFGRKTDVQKNETFERQLLCLPWFAGLSAKENRKRSESWVAPKCWKKIQPQEWARERQRGAMRKNKLRRKRVSSSFESPAGTAQTAADPEFVLATQKCCCLPVNCSVWCRKTL